MLLSPASGEHQAVPVPGACGVDREVPHGLGAPSLWVQRWSHLAAPGARVLDVACGHGRHVTWFTQRGCRVTGIDRNAEAIAAVNAVAEGVLADIERDPWPLGQPPLEFDVVLVTNYLWRPLMPVLLASLAPGGLLIIETFAQGQETVGRPTNPDFLLQTGELLRHCAGLRVIAYEDGFEPVPARFVQRVVAVRDEPMSAPAPSPARYALTDPLPR